MDDDWYRATTPWRTAYYSTDPGSKQTWRSDVSASTMGCVEQFQWCNSAYPRDRGCGPLASHMDALYGAAPFFNVTEEDLASTRPSSSDANRTRLIWPWMAMHDHPTRLANLLSSLSVKSLESQSKLFSGIQTPLPKSQWQLDVLQWWHIILAEIQASWLVASFLFMFYNESVFCFDLQQRDSQLKISYSHLTNLLIVSCISWHVKEIMADRKFTMLDDRQLTSISG